MMQEAVKERRGERGVLVENLRPALESTIGRDYMELPGTGYVPASQPSSIAASWLPHSGFYRSWSSTQCSLAALRAGRSSRSCVCGSQCLRAVLSSAVSDLKLITNIRDVVKFHVSRPPPRRTPMATGGTSGGSNWHRGSRISSDEDARRWIQSCERLGLAHNTITAYARAMETFLGFCQEHSVDARCASRDFIAQYVQCLRTRPRKGRPNVTWMDSQAALSNATLQQHLTAVRLFFDFLVEDELIRTNPVGRGRYTVSKHFGGRAKRGLIPRFRRLPWIPSEEQWSSLLGVASREPIRNRCMLAFAYDAALRREELCQLRSDDLDPAHRLLRVRAETTKGRRERVLPYSVVSGELLMAYLLHRPRRLAAKRGPLFLSESPRNYSAPITLWTWSKVARSIALRAGVPRFSTHTLRHLCLTDLARSGWDLHELARFAGHQNLETTLQYVHLSGRDLADRFSKTMAQLHHWRLEALSNGSPPPGAQ